MARRIIFALAILALAVVAPIHAQTTPKVQITTGTLSGYVLAADGSRLANARVYLQPSDGKAAHTMLTNAAGHFSFTKIHPGLYDLRAHANDTWSEQHRNIVVRANQEMNVDLKIVPAAKTAPVKPTPQK